MSWRIVRRALTVVVVLVALVVHATPVQAAGWDGPGDSPNLVERAWHSLAGLWSGELGSAWAAVWEMAGWGIDPNGTPDASSTTSDPDESERGMGVDPNG